MTMKRFLGVTFVAAALTSFAAQAQDVDAAKLSERCAACHGPGGAKPIAPDYPILAGQYASYIIKALGEYKSGKRKNPVMGAQAAQLSQDEIEALAHFFDGQPTPLYTPTEEGAIRP
jgi:cytochrome c553